MDKKKDFNLTKYGKKVKHLRIFTSILFPIQTIIAVVPWICLKSCSVPQPTSDDKKNIDEINDILDDDWCPYMHKAVTILLDHDIDVTKLETEDPDTRYVWDQDCNKFVIIDNNTGQLVVGPDGYVLNDHTNQLWKMITPDEYDPHNPYGQYLKYDEANPDAYQELEFYKEKGELQFSSGIDVGFNHDLNIKYLPTDSFSLDPNRDVDTPIVYTEYGHLFVEGGLESIRHYGIAQTLTITEYDETYYERGKILGDLIIKSDASGKTPTIDISRDEDLDDEDDYAVYVNTIIVDNPNATINVNCGNADKDEGVGTIGHGEHVTGADLDEIVNIDPSIEKDVDKPVIITDEEIEPAKPGETLSGRGTSYSPYIITGREDFDIMYEYNNNIEDDSYLYFQFAHGDKPIDASGWSWNGQNINFQGEFDGNGLVLENLDYSLFHNVGHFEVSSSDPGDIQPTVIKNITINNVCIDVMENIGVVAKNCGNIVEFENVELHGFAMGALTGGFIGFGPSNYFDGTPTFMKTSFKNCINDMTLISSQEVAAWIHYPWIIDQTIAANSEIKLEDSIFNGHLTCVGSGSQGEYMNYFISSNGSKTPIWIKTKYSNAFLEKYGNPEGEIYQTPVWSEIDAEGFKRFKTSGYQSIHSADTTPCYYYPDEDPNIDIEHKNYLTKRPDGVWSIPTSISDVHTFPTTKNVNAKKLLAWITVGINLPGKPHITSTYFNETINIEDVEVGQEIYSQDVKNYLVRLNPEGVTETGVDPDGWHFNVVKEGAIGISRWWGGLIQLDDQNRGFDVIFFKSPATL